MSIRGFENEIGAVREYDRGAGRGTDWVRWIFKDVFINMCADLVAGKWYTIGKSETLRGEIVKKGIA